MPLHGDVVSREVCCLSFSVVVDDKACNVFVMIRKSCPMFILEMYRMPKFRDSRMRMHMRISVHEDPRKRMHMQISKDGDPRMRISVQEDPQMRMRMRIFVI